MLKFQNNCFHFKSHQTITRIHPKQSAASQFNPLNQSEVEYNIFFNLSQKPFMYVGHLRKKKDKKQLRKAVYHILPVSKPMNITSSASLANEVPGRASALEKPFAGPFCSPSLNPKYSSLTKNSTISANKF